MLVINPTLEGEYNVTILEMKASALKLVDQPLASEEMRWRFGPYSCLGGTLCGEGDGDISLR